MKPRITNKTEIPCYRCQLGTVHTHDEAGAAAAISALARLEAAQAAMRGSVIIKENRS